MSFPSIAIWDLQTSENVNVGDVAGFAIENSIEVIHDQGRKFTVTLPITESLWSGAYRTFGDGFPVIEEGDRKLIVEWEGETVFHGRVGLTEFSGDGTTNKVMLTAFDTWMELGFAAGDQAGRVVRDETGNFINPVFNAGGTASGGDLVQQILTNSQVVGAENPGPGGEGPLPVDLTGGTFDTSVPPAIDLQPGDLMDWPQMVGDFFTQITETGVCDIVYRPLSAAESVALTGYEMTEVSAVNQAGTDLSGSVNFDYWTGDKNAGKASYTGDFSTVCNKLYDYLGPRNPALVYGTGNNNNQWAGNITPGSPGTTVDPTDSRARYGTFMQIRAFDSIGTENASRPLYLALWNMEAGLRLNGRKLLYLTPQPGSAGLFKPFVDFNVSDQIAVNTGGDFGPGISGTQRVMGIKGSWDKSGVFVVSDKGLLTTADAG